MQVAISRPVLHAVLAAAAAGPVAAHHRQVRLQECVIDSEQARVSARGATPTAVQRIASIHSTRGGCS